MVRKIMKTASILTMAAVLAACQAAKTLPIDIPVEVIGPGYRCVEFDGTEFLMCGTGGRLDRITPDDQVQNLQVPTEEDLLDILIRDDLTLIAGSGGTLLYSSDGEHFEEGRTGTSSDLYEIAYFNGNYYAASEKGVVLCSKDGRSWSARQTGIKDDIVSIAANGKILMAITRQSDIITSTDGKNWEVENFNTVYQGYYDPLVFTEISAIGNLFCVVSQSYEDMGVPHIMMSDTGEVWTFKPLEQINGLDVAEPISLKLNAIGYDLDQLLLACDGGRILTVSDCYKCNKVDTYAQDDLRDLALGAEKLMIVGDNYTYTILDKGVARQYEIQPEQAYKDMLSGKAAIIDVRTDQEYDGGHILGCIHIPLDQIEEKLPEMFPSRDTKLIFYCQSGGRSKNAVDLALQLGYERSYNLGAFEDWPYTVE